ncbi:hypothetical protein EI94DRAFT_1704624 [Lactarius quietus]|nr:hypothetical protein EI94DRAFT_1704624 [Lactarius quietus]
MKKSRQMQESTLPPLTIIRPRGEVAAAPAALGKRPLSPEDGTTTTSGQGQARSARRRTKMHQIADSTPKYPPPLELTDEERPTRSHTGGSKVPPGGTTAGTRKLRRKTLLTEAVAPAGNSSTNTNTDTGTDTNTDTDTDTEADSESIPAERANLTKAKPSAFSQRVMHERPSWSTAADDGHSDGEDNSEVPQVSNGRKVTPVLSNSHQETPQRSNGHHVSNPGTPVKWPAETNLVIPDSNRIKLKDQSEVIQETVTDSLAFLRASIMLEHVFPGGLQTMTFIMHALVAGTAGHPNASALCSRILNDHIFLAKLATLPRGRISIFRGEVKERCAATVALLINVNNPPSLIADLVDKQINDNYNYIFPRRASNVNLLSAPPLRSQPYRSTVIISVLCALFFTGAVPFVQRHAKHFPSYQAAEGTANREVPKAMVAIVATGLYAALKEWSTGEYKRYHFTANMYLDVYKGHLDTLDKIENQRKGTYHRMMSDIYYLANTNTGQVALPPVPTLDMDTLEFEESED